MLQEAGNRYSHEIWCSCGRHLHIGLSAFSQMSHFRILPAREGHNCKCTFSCSWSSKLSTESHTVAAQTGFTLLCETCSCGHVSKPSSNWRFLEDLFICVLEANSGHVWCRFQLYCMSLVVFLCEFSGGAVPWSDTISEWEHQFW